MNKSTSPKKAAKTSAKQTARKKSAAKTATRTTDRTKATAKKPTVPRTTKADTKRAKAGASKAGEKAMSKEATNGQGHTSYGMNNQEMSREELRKAKSGLGKKDLAYFRQLLLEKRVEIIGDMESLQSDARNSGGAISYEHMADVGTDSYEQEFALGLAESERKILNEIDDALERMSDGIYGVCVASGQPIGKPRLEIKPWAKYCIDVAREREKRGLMG